MHTFIVTNSLGYKDADTFEDALNLQQTLPGRDRPVILMEEAGAWYEISFTQIAG